LHGQPKGEQAARQLHLNNPFAGPSRHWMAGERAEADPIHPREQGRYCLSA